MKHWMSRALATRLALVFAAVTVVVFSVAGFHLYHFLDEQLRRRDDIALLGTLEIMRNQLAKRGDIDAVHAVLNLLHAAYGPDAVVLAIRDASGNLIAASSRDAYSLPADRPVPLGDSPDVIDIADWRQNGATRGRIISAWLATGAGDRVLLTLARDATASGVVLDEHAREVLVTLGAGVLCAWLLGYAAARRALLPVKRIAETAGRITANQLDARLRAEDAPQELTEMIRAFNLMLDRLQESFRRLSRFSADLAHDLQTPIGNLMGETQVALSRRRSVPEYEALLASNIEELERLSRMIRDMLFLAKADNPETVIDRQPVDLRRELDKVAEYYDTLREDGRPAIHVSGSGWVLGDRMLIQRAIQNLVSNALRHSDGGPVEATISAPDTGYVDLAVSNGGPGIPAEHQPYVFDRFYRTDAARTRSSEGSGLGLAIVKSIAALHGGQVLLASTPNVVTTFTLRLPACERPSEAPDTRKAA